MNTSDKVSTFTVCLHSDLAVVNKATLVWLYGYRGYQKLTATVLWSVLRKMFWVWFLCSSLVLSFPSCLFMLLVFFAGFTKHGTLLRSREPHQTPGNLPEVGQPADEGVLPPRRHGAGEKAGYQCHVWPPYSHRGKISGNHKYKATSTSTCPKIITSRRF